MKNSRLITRLIAGLILTFIGISALNCYAVSNQEMEQARATTALWYLRYANNGSDYLEKLNPTTMAELEKSLKQKERDNIKAFKAVAVPTDYAGWDKEKLVEYWSVTFFKSQGLDASGVIAKNRVRKKILQMQIAAPAPEPVAPDPASSVAEESAPAENVESGTPDALPTGAEIMESEQMLEDSISQSAGDNLPASKKSSDNTSTWIYIAALLVLVGVVIWLVIFASKTMQNQSARRAEEEEGEELAPVRSVDPQVPVADSSIREKYARTLASKEEEIRALNREIHDLREECMRLGEENGRLASDLAMSKRELDATKGRLRAATVAANVASSSISTRQEEIEPEKSDSPRKETKSEVKKETPNEIFLGRVNSKGLFVRADRQPVEDKSFYVLMTQDGFTGSYRLLQRGYVIELGLQNPQHYLAGGCVAVDIDDTEGMESIRTLASGTAVFEDGCWRVLRKAKIAYE